MKLYLLVVYWFFGTITVSFILSIGAILSINKYLKLNLSLKQNIKIQKNYLQTHDRTRIRLVYKAFCKINTFTNYQKLIKIIVLYLKNNTYWLHLKLFSLHLKDFAKLHFKAFSSLLSLQFGVPSQILDGSDTLKMLNY